MKGTYAHSVDTPFWTLDEKAETEVFAQKRFIAYFGNTGQIIANIIRTGRDSTIHMNQENGTIVHSVSGNRILKIFVIPIETTNGLINQVLIRDITEQRRACLAYAEREAIKEALMHTESMLNLLPDPTFVIDVHGIIRLWNQAMVQLTHIQSHDMIGKGGL